jgi:glycine cleavage system H protein
MPLSGKILEINKKLDANPELVNSEPYGDGWMVKIEISDAAQVAELLSSGDYKTLIGV